jgi:uncharacterized protein YyaL (SSP411 family)
MRPTAALAALFLAAAHGAAMETPPSRPALPSAAELEKLPPDGGPKWNRLVFEGSPYLQQHAGNPVDWHPWGDEAFELARQRDLPVFLSIGYSTCHWCHVMEHESFEDPEVARLLNESFIPIKVDREELPDVDQLYMTVTQAMTGSGGWPMTVVMTADRKPFFAGTYFPKESRMGRPGMLELLPELARLWTHERGPMLAEADRITAALAALSASQPGKRPGVEMLDAAHRELRGRHDAANGGFGTAPKFPTPGVLAFLLRHWKRTGDATSLEMVEATLDAMRRGGLFDHVGHGFARYSTDPRWLLPHFEKMLYDQAQLVLAYTEAHAATGHERHAEVVREVMGYVLRDMTSPRGGFYSAEDADSEGVEGKFYLWTPEEMRAVLGDELATIAIAAWGVQEGGNFRDQSTGRRTGESILHFAKPLPEIARDLKMEPAALEARLDAARARLFAHREKRVRPFKDDKVLTDWNGLMIAAAARAGAVLEEPAWVAAADEAADFVLSELRGRDGRLKKRWRDGRAAFPAVLDDHAFLTWGLIELHQATQEPKRLRQAAELTEITLEHFRDARGGGFYLSADDGEKLLVRSKEVYDGALPSGNSVTAWNLLRLASLLGRPEWEKEAERVLEAFAGSVERAPSGHCQLLHAVDFAAGPTHEIVIAGEPEEPSTQALLRALRQGFHPRAVVLLRSKETAEELAKLAPFTKGQRPLDGRAAAYVCVDHACHAPTTDVKRMLALLESSAAPPEERPGGSAAAD